MLRLCTTLIRGNPERVQYKQSRAGPMDERPALLHEEQVSQEDFLVQGEQDSGLHSKSFPALSGPARRKTKAPFV